MKTGFCPSRSDLSRKALYEKAGRISSLKTNVKFGVKLKTADKFFSPDDSISQIRCHSSVTTYDHHSRDIEVPLSVKLR